MPKLAPWQHSLKTRLPLVSNLRGVGLSDRQPVDGGAVALLGCNAGRRSKSSHLCRWLVSSFIQAMAPVVKRCLIFADARPAYMAASARICMIPDQFPCM